MKQTLVIGSTVVDVLLDLPALPRRGEDINIAASEYRIGGCACNVFKALKHFGSPALLCSPVGGGIYGRMVRDWFEKEGMRPLVSLEEENGCCYCMIEPDGERSFLSHHGAEYLFSRTWMKDIDFSRVDSVFICGIELEEATGGEIVDFVNEHSELELYFAPGPRIKLIPPERMERILRPSTGSRGPLLHLNEIEVLRFSGKHEIERGAQYLAEITGNSVVVTLGEKGCYCLSKAGGRGSFIPGFPVRAVNTVGAGDAHCGTLIACLKEGISLEGACLKANKTGAAVVSGSVLDDCPDLF